MAEEKEKPVYDDQPLARLLEAAYVLQEHNRALKALEPNLELPGEAVEPQAEIPLVRPPSTPEDPARKDDYTLTLAQIVETQHQIQARHLEFDDAVALVAERVVEIAKAGGASIGFVEGKKVIYRAAAGSLALAKGTEVAIEKALCVANLRTGQVIRCPDVNAEFLVDVEECRRRGIQSLIAVPVYQEDVTSGALELYYSTPHAFTEQDVHTCQLMAGLVTEALGRNKERAAKKSLAEERALMLEALEKLKPNLAALMESAPVGTTASAPTISNEVCRKCGHQLMGEEQFCGSCGLSRAGQYEPPSMQSKVASLWQMQEARKRNGAAPSNGTVANNSAIEMSDSEKPLADSIEEEMPELFAPPEFRPAAPEVKETELPEDLMGEFDGDDSQPAEIAENQEISSTETALVKADRPWTSAASTRAFLEQLGGMTRAGGLRGFWEARRGDVYLGIAIVLVVVVLWWAMWSRPVSATNGHAAGGQHKVNANADLSLFDRMLIGLGLAEAPPAPDSKGGNPDAQVWVDLQTALYYCPGADLYGKTPKGKFTTQKDAQLDQFESASRKACD